ncbi:MAG TPA: 50S ribosomal protein L24 [Chlamydiales bacterium]|jgi:large subunit ribosomal protein L24|nr:50S ribosomal protein L24 [Chlamydiales bacterium]
MSKKIRKGDRVVVISGNDKGKTGEVLSRSEDRIIVQGVNIRKKHLKRTQQMQGGRIVEMEVPIHISNVAVTTKEGQKIRLRTKRSESGERQLVFQSGGKETVYRSMKKPV